MRHLLTFLFFCLFVQMTYAQPEYKELKEFPYTLERSYTKAVGLEIDNSGEMKLSGQMKDVNMSIRLTSKTLLVRDHKRNGDERFIILEVGSFLGEIGSYYMKVKSTTDQEEAEVLLDNKKMIWTLTYGRGGFMLK